MDMTDVPLFSMLKAKMGWLSERQRLLSQNVANADTPRYTPKDLQSPDFEQALREQVAGGTVRLATTNPMHIASTSKAIVGKPIHVRDKETDAQGNSVSLEEEMIKVADTQAQYQAASNLYAKALTMMKTAIGKSS
jgi:flagellar basal-body rod protein FlgB